MAIPYRVPTPPPSFNVALLSPQPCPQRTHGQHCRLGEGVGFDSCVDVEQCSRAFIFNLRVSIRSSLGVSNLDGYRLMIRGSYWCRSFVSMVKVITGDAGIVYGVPFRLLGCALHIQTRASNPGSVWTPRTQRAIAS